MMNETPNLNSSELLKEVKSLRLMQSFQAARRLPLLLIDVHARNYRPQSGLAVLIK